MRSPRSANRGDHSSGNHQTRARSVSAFVSTVSSSARLVSRLCTQRCERSTYSLTSRALTTTPSASRIASRSSSSVTVGGRPTWPISSIQLSSVVNTRVSVRHSNGAYNKLAYVRWNGDSRPFRGAMNVPARHKRAGPASHNPAEAMSNNTVHSIEFSGGSEQCKQVSRTNEVLA